MIKLEKTETYGWEAAIRGMRNPMNSWEKSDTRRCWESETCVGCMFATDDGHCDNFNGDVPIIGPNDLDLMRRLAKGGPVHAKYRRQIFVSVDITAPLYWWKEFDTYKVGTTANSCSTMHKIHAYKFDRSDFSCEKMFDSSLRALDNTITELNFWRHVFINGGTVYTNNGEVEVIEARNKRAWEQMIQLLPSSYNQKRTVTMTYENLYNMYYSRKDHKLDEWRVGFCEWAKSLPYSELFTMEWEEKE